jgi:Na+/H+ antiporter NhaD/arsenite permease-like protein
MARLALYCLCGLAFFPTFAFADQGNQLHVHPLSVIPFAVLLLAIALLPLVAGHFWHSNLRKLLVAGVISLPVLGYLWFLGPLGVHRLADSLLEYVQFIALLASLYAVSGGIVLKGDLKPSARVNAGFLLLGAVLANFIGTTGASMLLIRPFLKINALRYSKSHLPVFFIFIVSNLGGLLTPLGDPPLFLGFLRGIDFFWTLSLWQHWIVVNGIVIGIFFIWESIALRREPKHEMENLPGAGPLRLLGTHNFVFLAGILAVILLLSPDIAHKLGLPSSTELALKILGKQPPAADPLPLDVAGVKALLFIGPLFVLSLLSIVTTSRQLRKDNEFTWGAIIEVAVLFVGIFVTMVPALALLESDGARLGIDAPWKFFWATGLLSSFLDNAPTYLTFATIAAEGKPYASLMIDKPLILQAISAGAVFMGANTYIGNGPNFMVKAIADAAGYKTPSFFGYMLYSGLILLPTFGLVTYLFFLP